MTIADGGDLVRQWDGTWVAEPWTNPIWHDCADLQRRFFVVDHRLRPRDVLAAITDGAWNTWAARDLALEARFVVGTRAHRADLFVASIVSSHVHDLVRQLETPPPVHRLRNDRYNFHLEGWWSHQVLGIDATHRRLGSR